MFRDLATIVYGTTVALGLGITTAIWATDGLPFFSAFVVDRWQAHPSIGGERSDPYSRAFLARTGILPLAAAEGLEFNVSVDDKGEQLNAACTYLIQGATPPARRWTLQVFRNDVPYSAQQNGYRTALKSGGILRTAGGELNIRIAPTPQSGNWLYAGTGGPFELMLTLYDTAIASDTGLTGLSMPDVSAEGCGRG